MFSYFCYKKNFLNLLYWIKITYWKLNFITVIIPYNVKKHEQLIVTWKLYTGISLFERLCPLINYNVWLSFLQVLAFVILFCYLYCFKYSPPNCIVLVFQELAFTLRNRKRKYLGVISVKLFRKSEEVWGNLGVVGKHEGHFWTSELLTAALLFKEKRLSVGLWENKQWIFYSRNM